MRAANPSSALALTLVDELVRHGLRHAVLAPGSRSAPLAIALAEDARIDLRVEIDERSAAFLALGVARATRRPAVVVTTSGTATANLHPAVVEADQDRVPLLVLTADRPPELRGTGANQTTDQVKLFGSSVRWFAEVGVPEGRAGEVAYWRSLASRAWAEAADGPVHLNLALRDPLVPAPAGEPIDVDGRPDGAPWTAVVRAPDAPVLRGQGDDWQRLGEADGGALADVLQPFAGARGLVTVGQTTAEVGAVLALAERLGWPVLAEPVSSARRGEMAISTYAALLAAPEFAQAHHPDVVLRIGRLGLARSLLSLLGSDVPQVLVDPAGAWLDPGRVLSHVVTADPSSACAAVLDAGAPEPAPAQWTLSWLEAEDSARGAIDALLDGEAAPTEPRTARDLAAALPDGSTLVVASSMPVRDLDLTMRPRLGLRVLANRGASGIDGFVSTALGVALASASPSGAGRAGSPSGAGRAGSRPTAALAGDLSLLHDSNGFLVRPRPDLVMVVVNNDGGGIFSFLPQADYPAAFERVFGTPHGVEPAALAALHGLHHTRLEAAADLPAAVQAGLAAGGVHLVEVRTERGANRELHRRLLEVVARAV